MSAILLKKFDNEPVYNEKHLKTKIIIYEGKVTNNFHNDKMPSAFDLLCF